MKRIKQLLLSIVMLAVFGISHVNAQSCWSLSDSSYTMGFEGTDTAEFYGHWTIDDTNDNDTTWETSGLYEHTGDSCIVIKQYGEDWLFSRCFTLDSNVAYKISFWYRKTYPYIPDQSLILCVGDTAKSTAMTDTLLDMDSIDIETYNDTFVLFTAPDDTVYVFGWYAYGTSSYDWTRIYIDDIELEEYVCDSLTVDLGNDTTYCNGDSVMLLADTGYVTYDWNGGLSDTNFLWVDTPGTYWVVVTDTNGCTGTDTVVVTIDSVNISISITDSTFCEEDSLLLDAGSGYSAYNWMGDDSLSTSRYLYIQDTGTYYVAVTNSYGCVGTDTIVIVDSMIIPAPHDTIVLVGADTICLTDSVFITANIVGDDNGKYTFYWWGVDTVNTDTFIWVKVSGNYGFYATDTTTGCIATSDTIKITVLEPYDEEEICIVTVDSASGYNKIVWEKTDSVRTESFNIYRLNTSSDWDSIGNVDYDSLSIFVDSTSKPKQRAYSYAIAVIDTCGNESELSYEHTTIHLTINQGVGGVNNLIWNAYYGFDFDTYKIYRDTSATQNNPYLYDSISSAFNSYTDLYPTDTNYYAIEVVRDSSCSPTSKKKGNIYLSSFSNWAKASATGLSDNELLNNEVLVYPNPYNDFTNIEYTLAKQSDVLIEVYNVIGDKITVIANETQNAGSYKYKFSAATSGCPAGVYYLKVKVDNSTALKKLIEIQ